MGIHDAVVSLYILLFESFQYLNVAMLYLGEKDTVHLMYVQIVLVQSLLQCGHILGKSCLLS